MKRKIISPFLAFVTFFGCFSLYSTVASAASVKNTGPNAIKINYPSAGDAVSFDETLRVRWSHYNEGEGVNHYWFTVRENGVDGAKIYNQSVGTKTSFALKKGKLKPNTTYKLYVAAHDTASIRYTM